MGATTDFTELYNDFRSDDFFSDAVDTVSWTEDTGSSFDPLAGTVTPSTTVHTAQVFSVSSGDKSQQPKSMQFTDIQVDDRFIKTLRAEFKTPPNGITLTWKGVTYTVIETITDALELTDHIQLRR